MWMISDYYVVRGVDFCAWVRSTTKRCRKARAAHEIGSMAESNMDFQGGARRAAFSSVPMQSRDVTCITLGRIR